MRAIDSARELIIDSPTPKSVPKEPHSKVRASEALAMPAVPNTGADKGRPPPIVNAAVFFPSGDNPRTKLQNSLANSTASYVRS
jgi:hypothetical protein